MDSERESTRRESAGLLHLEAELRSKPSRAHDETIELGVTILRQDLGPIVLLGLLLAGVDFFAIPVAVSGGPGLGAILGVMAFGIICAQVGLVATWGVFSAAAFRRRVAVSAALGVIFYGSFALGVLTANQFTPGGPPPEVLLVFMMFCPIIFFAVQAPLWSARIWLRWEVARLNQAPSGSYRCATGIKDFVWGMAAASVALALVNFSTHLLPAEEPAEAILAAVASMSGVAAAASSATMLPLLFFTLGTRRIAAGVAGVALWCGCVVAILAGGSGLLRGGLSPGTRTAISLFVGAFVAVLCTCLLLARSQGYRLHRRRFVQGAPVTVR